MKYVKRLGFLFCIGLIVFNSCEKKIPPQLQAIPADAAFVVAIEAKNIVDKGGLKNLNEYTFIQKMRSELSNENQATQSLINRILENPKSTGLDIDRTYIYGVNNGNKSYVSFVFKMDKMGNFENTLKELNQIQDIDFPDPIDKGAYKIIQQDEVAITWNKDFLFLFAGESAGQLTYADFFTMPEDKSILGNKDFTEFQKRNYDLGFWASYTSLMDMYSKMMSNKFSNLSTGLSGINLHAYVNFEKGELNISYKLTPKEAVNQLYTKYPILKKNFDSQLLRDFPDKSYLAFKVSVDVLAYIKMIKEFAGSDIPIDQMMLSDPMVNTVINGLGGDMVFSLYSFAQGPLPIPLMGLGFTVKSKDDFDKFVALIPEDIVARKDDHYVISTGFVTPFYFAYKDNRVLITDDVDGIVAFSGKGYSKNLTSGDLSEAIKNPYLMYLNLDIDSYPQNIRSLAQSEIGGKFGSVLSLLSPYKDVSMIFTDDYEGIFSLKFKDKNQNSLKQILKGIDQVTANSF
ncbi:MAG: DUF4836 family protein [Bacteroidales bacterium]|jgi:hypothetical protein|nr:DUF4836 family protein [Bacteroidales bacterium]